MVREDSALACGCAGSCGGVMLSGFAVVDPGTSVVPLSL